MLRSPSQPDVVGKWTNIKRPYISLSSMIFEQIHKATQKFKIYFTSNKFLKYSRKLNSVIVSPNLRVKWWRVVGSICSNSSVSEDVRLTHTSEQESNKCSTKLKLSSLYGSKSGLLKQLEPAPGCLFLNCFIFALLWNTTMYHSEIAPF